MDLYRVQMLLVRAVTALCNLAASESEDARSELVDEVAWGLQVWLDASAAERPTQLRAWCDDAASLLSQMASSEKPFLKAQLALLRLRASLPAPVVAAAPAAAPKKTPPAPANGAHARRASIGASQRKLLAAVKSSGPIRSRDLITLLAGQLSDRTVKRSLKDLASAGLLRRTESEDGIVYEAVAE